MIGVKSPNGAVTRYEYDDLGNQLLEVSPDRGIIKYRYDEAGNIIESTDANNITVIYRYDALNRLTDVRYPDATQNTSFAYDSCRINRLCTATAGKVKTAYQYGGWGNITQQQQTVDKYITKTQYQYDSGNRVVSVIYPDNSKVNYQRDTLGRITKVTQNGKTIVKDRRYRADGQFNKQTFGNGITETRQHDVQGRLAKQAFNATIDSIDYDYDKNGNVLVKYENQYQYDSLNRLVADNDNQYSYDANSNRTTTLDDKLGYYSHSNQLYSINEQTIEHDPTGNQLNDSEGRKYHYNEAGKLVKVTKESQTIAEYNYNAFSQRVSKRVNDKTIYFTYNLNDQLISEAGTSKTNYVWLDDQPIYQQSANDVQGGTNVAAAGSRRTTDDVYLVNDHLNTPRIGTNQAKEVTWLWHSDAFGQAEPTGQATVNLRFPGQYADAETGLYYNWHRYYNPKTGRYVTSDPIGLIGGINTFGYVGGNPLVGVDPSGLVWFRLPEHGDVVNTVGRDEHFLIPSGGWIGSMIEHQIPAGYTFGAYHDEFVKNRVAEGWPDLLINIPSMVPLYLVSLGSELYYTIVGAFGGDTSGRHIPRGIDPCSE